MLPSTVNRACWPDTVESANVQSLAAARPTVARDIASEKDRYRASSGVMTSKCPGMAAGVVATTGV